MIGQGKGAGRFAGLMAAWARPFLPPLGGVLLLLGERLFTGSPAAPWLSGAGLLLVALAAAAATALALRRDPAPAGEPGNASRSGVRGVRWWVPAPHALLLAAGVLALLAPDAAHPGTLRELVRWAWALCLLMGSMVFVFVEHALWRQRRAHRLEWRRVAWAGTGGLTLGLLLAVVVVFNFAFDRLGWEWNLAYFRTTQPSAATREVALELPEPVSVGVFFTLDSNVAPLMRGYFDALADDPAVSGQLQVERVDAELNPAVAERYKVNGNGWVVLRRGETHTNIFVGDTFSKARDNLRKFDQTFYGKLLEMAQPRRTVYFTVGHRERNETVAGPAPEGVGFKTFQTMLRNRNFKTLPLGLEQGLGTEVPEDAHLVVIAGPELPFRPAELDTLARYLERGGRMLVFLEPGESMGDAREAAADAPPRNLADLLSRYGVAYTPQTQANDRFYGRRTFTQADHALLVTVRYQNHPAVAALRAVPNQFPLLFLESGALRKSAVKVKQALNVQEVIKAMPGTWSDGNGNFAFDAPGETKGDPVLAMAVWSGKQKPPTPHAGGPPAAQATAGESGPALFVFADADVASDLLLGNRANRLMLETTVAWLTGDTGKAPAYPESEEDVRIAHAKADDWLWFYLPVFGVPLLVLGFGFWRTGRGQFRRETRHG